MSNYILRPAEPAELDIVYQIRYMAFSQAKLIKPNPQCRLQDIYDDSGYALALVLAHGPEIIGTIRLVSDSTIGLPMDDEGFGDYLNRIRQSGRRIAEAGRLALSPAHQNRINLSRYLCQYIIRIAIMLEFNDMVIMVTDQHAAYYERMFMFELITKRHSCQYTKNASALRLDLDGLANRYRDHRLARRYNLHEYIQGHDTEPITSHAV